MLCKHAGLCGPKGKIVVTFGGRRQDVKGDPQCVAGPQHSGGGGLHYAQQLVWVSVGKQKGNKTSRFTHDDHHEGQSGCLKRSEAWSAYRKMSRMFHKKKSMHTIGLLWNSSSMMTTTRRRFFSVT